MPPDPASLLRRAREVLAIEQQALSATADALNDTFAHTATAVLQATAAGGKIICSGVGKSAHIAQKLVGTFNSTGLSACFLDATQALHGDLGLCAEGDIAILFSNSGQSDEVLRLLSMLRRLGVPIVACTSQADSDLALESDHKLIYVVPREACPLELAPTASTPGPGRRSRHGLARSSRPDQKRFRQVSSRWQSGARPAPSCSRHHANR